MPAGSFDTTHSETLGRWHFNFERFQDRHPASTFGWLNNPGSQLIVFHRHFFLYCYSSVFYASGRGIKLCVSPDRYQYQCNTLFRQIRDTLKPYKWKHSSVIAPWSHPRQFLPRGQACPSTFPTFAENSRPRLLHYGFEPFCKTRINNLSEASMYSLT